MRRGSAASRWGLVAAAGAGCAAVILFVAANHAIPLQVVGAIGGAVLTTGGVALMSSSWRHRHVSELRRFVVAYGFFLTCLGGFFMVAGVGFFH
jgi:hypothetical protein